jgi:histidinol dehydrogenase
LVISDGNTEPDYVAYDLLSQAEHGPDSQVIHISPDRDFLENVQQSINRIMKTLETRDVAQDALLNSKSIWVQDIETAIDISNNYAPEHLIVSLENPRLYLDSIESAGSIFLGYWSPESAGDYCSGTNHVLPTAGYAKSLSGVSVESFTKSVSIQELTKSGLKQLSETISLLARVEGLEAHAKAVEVRLSDYE